jgi:hypothetical protein
VSCSSELSVFIRQHTFLRSQEIRRPSERKHCTNGHSDAAIYFLKEKSWVCLIGCDWRKCSWNVLCLFQWEIKISCRSYGWPVVNGCLQALVFELFYSHTHTHTHTHTLSLSLSLTLTLTFSLSLYNAWFLLPSLLIRSVFRVSFFCNILVEIICQKFYEIINLT